MWGLYISLAIAKADQMFILLYVIIAYIVLLVITPKANNLHEILHIPIVIVSNLLTSKKNLITHKIRFGKKWRQYFLLHLPKHQEVTKDHIVLFFHGGGWMAGNPELIQSEAQILANHGYASIFSNYRKAPWVSYYGMREDITLCLQKIEEIKKEFNLDGKKIIIGGMSAGANLAALLAFQDEELKKINFDPNLISGLLLCGPPIDLSRMPWSIPLYLFAGNKGSEKFKKANPINSFNKNHQFPILLIHGNKDGLVSYNNTLSFMEKTKRFPDCSIRLHTLENGTHMQTAEWGHKDGEVRKVIFDWLKELNYS